MLNSDSYEYNFEIETILQQFISIIDNAIIMRYSVDKNSNERMLDEVIKPGYILGTKQRVFLDIINKAKNYELPLVIISLNSISFAKDRNAAKNQNITVSTSDAITSYARPTPITIKVDVTILTKYMTDLYQIYGKLASQFQPALSFSWFVPQTIRTNWVELRNKIEWDGELNLDIRTESKESDEDKFSGKMAFTIDGWLFPSMNTCSDNIIFNIGTSVVPSEEALSRIHDEISLFRPLVYSVLKGKEWKKYNNPRQFATAHPMITSIFKSVLIKDKIAYYILDYERAKNLKIKKNTLFTINGYNLENVKVIAIPKTPLSKISGLQKYHKVYEHNLHPFPNTLEEKNNNISGYLLNIRKQTDNQLTIDFQNLTEINGKFDIAIVNDIDYDLLSERKGFILETEE